MDVFWFSGTVKNGFTVHHERDVHVIMLGGKVFSIEEQPSFSPEGFLGLVHRHCTRGVPTQSFPFNPFDHMTRNEIAIFMKKAIKNAIGGVQRHTKKVKKGAAA